MRLIELINKDFKCSCRLCNNEEAIQTNSHIIPNFLVSKHVTYNPKIKRDSEVLFFMKPFYADFYVGRSVPEDEIDRFFDSKEIQKANVTKEKMHNPFTVDYLLCPKCEANLSMYLETPYSGNAKKKDSFVSYMFWISVVWRLSVTRLFGFRLPKVIEDKLQVSINKYFEIQGNEIEQETLLNDIPFYYRIIQKKDNKVVEGAMFYAEFDNNILTMTLGNIVVCVSFYSQELYSGYKYYGIEDEFINAPINCGDCLEQIKTIEESKFKTHLNHLAMKIMTQKLKEGKEIADCCWNYMTNSKQMPDTVFVDLIKKLSAMKTGDMLSEEKYVDVINWLEKKNIK